MLTTLWNAGGQNWRPTKSLLLASSLKSTGKAAWQDNDISGWGKTKPFTEQNDDKQKIPCFQDPCCWPR